MGRPVDAVTHGVSFTHPATQSLFYYPVIFRGWWYIITKEKHILALRAFLIGLRANLTTLELIIV